MTKMRVAFGMALCALLVTGCKVKETEDAEGDTQYQVETAPVNIGTDTQTVRVPDIDVGTDTTVTTTTH